LVPAAASTAFLWRQKIGLGAEMGQEGLEQFTQIKIINIAK